MAIRYTRTARGFTLMELLVVMGILTILMGTALPMVTRGMKREKIEKTRAELLQIEPAIRAYFEDVEAFPPTFDDLLENSAGVAGWTGPYANVLISSHGDGADVGLEKDAWGENYIVKILGPSRIEIRSGGSDGSDTRTDDIIQYVDVTPVRRAWTLTELAIINDAISAYNATHLPDAPLPTNYASLLAKLEGGGYLPGGTTRFEADGWGEVYVADPVGSTPVVAVTSTSLGGATSPPSDTNDG